MGGIKFFGVLRLRCAPLRMTDILSGVDGLKSGLWLFGCAQLRMTEMNAGLDVLKGEGDGGVLCCGLRGWVFGGHGFAAVG